jgi:hypothetical protein
VDEATDINLEVKMIGGNVKQCRINIGGFVTSVE